MRFLVTRKEHELAVAKAIAELRAEHRAAVDNIIAQHYQREAALLQQIADVRKEAAECNDERKKLLDRVLVLNGDRELYAPAPSPQAVVNGEPHFQLQTPIEVPDVEADDDIPRNHVLRNPRQFTTQTTMRMAAEANRKQMTRSAEGIAVLMNKIDADARRKAAEITEKEQAG